MSAASSPQITFTGTVDHKTDFPYACYIRPKGALYWARVAESVNQTSIMTAYAANCGLHETVVIRNPGHGRYEVVIKSR